MIFTLGFMIVEVRWITFVFKPSYRPSCALMATNAAQTFVRCRDSAPVV